MFFRFVFVFILQIRRIVENYGLVVISREGSNPEKYVYEHDILHKFKVSFLHLNQFVYSCDKIERDIFYGKTNYPRQVPKATRKFRSLTALSTSYLMTFVFGYDHF